MRTETYNEALKRARDVLNNEAISDDTIACLQSIFPELKESEDKEEKTRGKLIHLVKKSHEQGGYALHKWEADEMLTWLEKQNKQTTSQTNERAWLHLVSKVQELLKKLYSEHTINTYNPIEQKPADKVKPAFNYGEYIVHQGTGNIYTVVAVIDDKYQLKYGDNYTVQKCTDVDKCARLLNTAKDVVKNPFEG